MRAETAISERQACRLVGIYRSTLRYESQQAEETQALRARIVELAQERRRFGYRRICCDCMRPVPHLCPGNCRWRSDQRP